MKTKRIVKVMNYIDYCENMKEKEIRRIRRNHEFQFWHI